MPDELLDVVLHDNPWLEDSAAESQEVPSELEESKPEESQPPAETGNSESPRSRIELDPTDLYGSLRKLADEDPHFRNVLKSFSGREKQNELRQRVRELEKQLEQERLQRMQAYVRAVPEEKAQEAYENDPEFRQAYDFLTSYEPQVNEESEAYALQIEQIFEQADGWLPEARIRQYMAAMAPGGCSCNAISEPHGIYDHDEAGRELTPLQSFLKFKETFENEVRIAQQAWEQRRAQMYVAPSGSAPAQTAQRQAPQQAPQQQANRANVASAVDQLRNPRLMANPDVSMPTGGSSDGRVITKEEFERMSVDEIVRRWPNDGDFERDVAAGKILIPGLNM